MYNLGICEHLTVCERAIMTRSAVSIVKIRICRPIITVVQGITTLNYSPVARARCNAAVACNGCVKNSNSSKSAAGVLYNINILNA